MVDRAWRVTSANAAALRAWGEDPSAGDGLHLWDALPVDAPFPAVAALRARLETARRAGQVAVETIVGARGPWIVRATPIDDGRLVIVLRPRDVGGNGEPDAARSASRDAQRARQRLAALHAVTVSLGAALTPARVADAVMHAAIPALGANRGTVALLSDDGSSLEIVAASGYDETLLAPFRSMPVDAALPLTEAVRSGEAILLPSVEARLERYPHLAPLPRQPGAGATAALPLQTGGIVLGTLGFNWQEDRAFDADDQAFLDALARQCAQALERARLFGEERAARQRADRAAERLQTIADVARAITERPFDVREVVDAMAGVLARRVGDHCAVRIISADGSWLEPIAVRHVDRAAEAELREIALREPHHIGDGINGRVFKTGESVLASGDALTSLFPNIRPEYQTWAREHEIHSVLGVPLRTRDATFGTLFMWRGAPSAPFVADDLALVEDVAHRASLMLERARLFEAEQHARSEAEAANRAKAQFLAAMSHELRTPLNAIRGYVDLIEMGIRGDVTEAQRTDLERIRRNQRHLLALIDDLLSFARVEAGKLEVERAPVPLGETLAALEPMISTQASAAGVRVHVEPTDPSLTVIGDRGRIIQVCLNLLTNAVKATAAGGEVRLTVEEQDVRVLIRVHDSGVGIPADKLDAIFIPFTQLGRALNNPVGGTGLGLPIARALAEAMGGSLTAQSVVGQGSVFTLELPRSE